MLVHERVGGVEMLPELTESWPQKQISVPRHSADAAPPTAILGVPFDHLTLEEAVRRVEAMIASTQPHYLVTANVDFLVQARHDVELRRILAEADLVLCDGTPLVWVSWLLGHPLPERVAGADVAPLLIEAAARKGYRIFFLGGQPEVTLQAVEKLQAQYPDLIIAGHYSPPFQSLLEMDHEEILRWIRPARPDVLFVSFGCPKAEKWMAMHYRSLGVPVTIGVGATIDFLAGKKKRAPRWMRRSGTEWIFRLLQEPRRLFRRYMTDLWQFGRAILQQWWWLRAHWQPAELSFPHPIMVDENGWKHIQVQGRFSADTLRCEAATWSQVRDNHCLVDLALVTSIDSAAVGLLIQLQKRLQGEGFSLVLLQPATIVQRALRLMRQTNLFLIAADIAEARQLIQTRKRAPAVLASTSGGPLIWQGEITAGNAVEVWENTQAHIVSLGLRHERLTIDLSGVRFLDSTGVRLMAQAKRQALQLGATLDFTHPSSDVLNVVRLARLQNFLFGGHP
jgi:N-acetylglucosaminyldiphosphoundecaprenol N-acetyl-beta-D-mannosaminyltransferase